jgi:hypothetical protein
MPIIYIGSAKPLLVEPAMSMASLRISHSVSKRCSMKKVLLGVAVLMCVDSSYGRAQSGTMPYSVRMLPGTQTRSLPISSLFNSGPSPILIFPDLPVRHCFDNRLRWLLSH